MNILVLSDSHSGLRFMDRCVQRLKPDAIIHLGDYFEDGQALGEDYPHIPRYQVPGNCDRYRWGGQQPEILIEDVGGARLYMTHGHRHQVKSTLTALLRDARRSGADAVLYGHTHVADCRYEDGLWILNPGSCGYFGGSAGWMEIENGRIKACRVLREEDLPEIT